MFLYNLYLGPVMKSENFKREKLEAFSRISESELKLKKAEEAKERLDLRKIDSKVINLIEEKKKIRREIFDFGIF